MVANASMSCREVAVARAACTRGEGRHETANAIAHRPAPLALHHLPCTTSTHFHALGETNVTKANRVKANRVKTKQESGHTGWEQRLTAPLLGRVPGTSSAVASSPAR